MKDTSISTRKTEQLSINLEQDISSGITTGLENYRFLHNASPEINLTEIKTSEVFLNKFISFPLLISSMTGGSLETTRINQNLAIASQTIGLPMGVGSQRAAIDDPGLAPSFQVRRLAPDIPLLANLGAIQLNYGYTIDHCKKAVEMISADALILHLNPLQEALQPNGDTNFKGLLTKIESVVKNLGVPVIIKEVGWGINSKLAKRFFDMGVSAVDIAGAGGTSWSQVEMHRQTDPLLRELSSDFRDWGIPTSDAIIEIGNSIPAALIIASGGIKTGMDIAKCIALGASLVGMAGSILKSAANGPEFAIQRIEMLKREFTICMFASGIPYLSALKHTPALKRIR